MELFLPILVVCLVIYFLVLIIRIPIIIAENREIRGGNLVAISILSWLGIFFGLTWIVALILSLVYEGNVPKSALEMNVDNLSKLYDLKKKGAITPQEYEQYKKKILKK